ncbi:hypothetical protein IEG04_05680 [Olleya marilimosa]|nr:hypothetical protein [Olleya marilimosa]
MKYIFTIGLIYVIYTISVNIKQNLKSNKKVVWLNIVGLLIMLAYFTKHGINIINDVK